MTGLDGRTIEALRRGEEGAFTRVVDVLLPPVYRFLLRLSRDPSVADDLTQETFLALWQGVAKFRGASQFRTWVFGIAYRQFLRHRDRREIETVPFDDAWQQAEAADPETLFLAKGERERVRHAVYALPDLYREVFCLVHLEGLSYREAAQVLGRPVGTVKSRMNVALTLLRQELGGGEERDDGVPRAESIP